jgi:hypothetical protein
LLASSSLKHSNLLFVEDQKPEVGITLAAILATASFAAAPSATTFFAESSLTSATTRVTTTAHATATIIAAAPLAADLAASSQAFRRTLLGLPFIVTLLFFGIDLTSINSSPLRHEALVHRAR